MKLYNLELKMIGSRKEKRFPIKDSICEEGADSKVFCIARCATRGE